MMSQSVDKRQMSLGYKSILSQSDSKRPSSPKNLSTPIEGKRGSPVSLGRKSAEFSPKLNSTNTLNSTSPKSLKTSSQMNEEVVNYINKCYQSSSNPVLDFVVVLSDPSIPICNISSRNLTLKELSCISEALKGNLSLKELDLSQNNLGSNPEFSNEVSNFLRLNRGVQVLKLKNNNLKSDGVLILADGIRDNIALKELYLDHNEIGNHGAAGLAQALHTNTTLQVLDLQHNKVKCQGTIALASILKTNEAVKVFNFRFNEIADTGTAALGAALKLNNTLTELDLGGNLIGISGGKALAEGLALNTGLKKLNLRSNALSDVGAIAIAEALTQNNTLEELYLGNNRIEAQGCCAIAEALQVNTGLKKLDIQGIHAGGAGALALSNAFQRNSTLLEIILDLDKFAAVDAATIATGVRGNTTLMEFHMGDKDKIAKETYYSIITTLRLNKFVSSLLESTGFREHFEKNSAKIRQALGNKLQQDGNAETDVARLINYMSEQLKEIQKEVGGGKDVQLDVHQILQRVFPNLDDIIDERIRLSPNRASKNIFSEPSSIRAVSPTTERIGEPLAASSPRPHSASSSRPHSASSSRPYSAQHSSRKGRESPLPLQYSPPPSSKTSPRVRPSSVPVPEFLKSEQHNGSSRPSSVPVPEIFKSEQRNGGSRPSSPGGASLSSWRGPPAEEPNLSAIPVNTDYDEEKSGSDRESVKSNSSFRKQTEQLLNGDREKDDVLNTSQRQRGGSVSSKSSQRQRAESISSVDGGTRSRRESTTSKTANKPIPSSSAYDFSSQNSEVDLLSLMGELIDDGVKSKFDSSVKDFQNTVTNAVQKQLEEKLLGAQEEYFQKMNNSFKQLEAELTTRLEGKLDKKTDAILQEIAHLQAEMFRTHELATKQLETESKNVLASIRDEIVKMVKAEVQGQLQSTKEQGVKIESIKSEYLTKLLELQQTVKQEHKLMRNDVQENLQQYTQQLVNSSSQTILDKIKDLEEKLHQDKLNRIDSHEKRLGDIEGDHDERLTQLEELVMLQQEEQARMSETLKSMSDQMKKNTMTAEFNTSVSSRELLDKLQSLENRLHVLTENQTHRNQEKIAQLESYIKHLEDSRVVMETATNEEQKSIRRLEEEIKQRHFDSMRMIESINSREREKMEKKLLEISWKVNLVEEALRKEQKTSLEALQALISD